MSALEILCKQMETAKVRGKHIQQLTIPPKQFVDLSTDPQFANFFDANQKVEDGLKGFKYAMQHPRTYSTYIEAMAKHLLNYKGTTYVGKVLGVDLLVESV